MKGRIEIDSALLGAVLREEIDRRLVRGEPEAARAYRRAIDDAYEAGNPAALFPGIDRAFFAELGLDAPLVGAAERARAPARRAVAVHFGATASTTDEGADLVGPERDTIGIRLRPIRFADLAGLGCYLDHEFNHAADLLDPEFGFDGRRAMAELPDTLVARRYRALWCASVDARLARAGATPLHDEPWHRRAIAAAFGRHAETAGDSPVEVPIGDSTPRHDALWAIASAVRSRCPLCRFPVSPECTPASDLDAESVARVRASDPAWRPELGLCDRCREYFGLLTVAPAPQQRGFDAAR